MQGQATALYLKSVAARQQAGPADAPRSTRRLAWGLAATAAPFVLTVGAMSLLG